ncbi:carboxylesterase family protein [Paenarthrobacter sp. NPDC058040]|uniref:carboxylesterase family protein n=1 Tax=unclassified Paenarthrobacter TaxID=2634190 RepID=UPI0036D7BAC3
MSTCLAYRNIRYASADRFSPAQLIPFENVEPDRGPGPTPPQNPSRFDVLLGPPEPLEQSEDCQVLSVFTPRTSGKRPVMMWFHGGAFITGGGELPWYDGSRLAEEQDVVVVSVTARLGALGYLCLGESEEPSPATTDQLTAVEWVHRNIAQFGGDPENITLFGQSAGGFAIEVLQRWGLGPHVKGVIYQSSDINLGRLSYQREDVIRQAKSFTEFIGCDPRSLTTAEILKAQKLYADEAGTIEIWAPVRPKTEQPILTRVLGGWTRDDTLPFIMIEKGIFEPYPGLFEDFGDAMRTRNATEMIQGTQSVADQASDAGADTWLYEFDWEVPASGWGSPHCIELPFLFGGRETWQSAPMLKGADWDLLERRGVWMRSIWGAFAKNGEPGAGWQRYSRSIPVINRFVHDPGVLAGPAQKS